MGKIDEAIEILKAFGLPKKQQNERSGRTLCALADIKETTPWSSAKSKLLRVHDIMQFISQHYGFTYAENSRETIRRQTIHQFEQARIVDRNPDNPSRPTNSGKTVYAIARESLAVIQSYGKPSFTDKLKRFIKEHGTLSEKYEKKREFHKVPIKIKGKDFYMSPGKHNKLQKEVLDNFAQRFTKGTILLYIGDTARKHFWLDKEKLQSLKIPVTKHDKLPDIVLYEEDRKRVFLIEAVTSHGPVSSKRHYEIENVLKDCPAEKIYVSAFPDFKTYLKYARDIAWETEVWISENPDHLIHYDGEKFISPH